MSKPQDLAREWATWKSDEPSQYYYCKLCNHHITGGVTRLKHHLAGTGRNSRKSPLVPSDVKKKCVKALRGMETKNEKGAFS